MRFFPTTGWLAGLRSAWRRARRGPDPADMGTAFGLDSITVVEFEASAAPPTTPPAPWERRLARRSRL
jgi:hypothetical protein